jgi:hypothetical protein
VDYLTPEEQARLVKLIHDKLGFYLAQDSFTEVTFDLFEDIAGMEGLSTHDAAEIINSMWKNYRVKTNP